MGALTTYLQEAFESCCPPGWSCRHEVGLLTPDLAHIMGFTPRVDVLLEKNDGTRRLWIEFEVSRADPVANHAKFATSHLFAPQPETDAFLSMVSSHVARGRHNLAACTIALMREVGMKAFQTVLLPALPGSEIKLLNHSTLEELRKQDLKIDNEIERALSVSEPIAEISERDFYYVANFFEVMENVRRWNLDMSNSGNRSLWGRRTIIYFVFDQAIQQFAPSKFCAYLPIAKRSYGAQKNKFSLTMSVPFYTQLNQTDPLFDGARARHHLVQRIGMRAFQVEDDAKMARLFKRWCETHQETVNVHPGGAIIIVPPAWHK